MADRYLDAARALSAERFKQLKAQLVEAEALVRGRACVYATGSFGRLEAGPHSDLDLFIVLEATGSCEQSGTRGPLDGVEEIKLKYYLIDAVDRVGIAKFDGGGRYLESHSIDAFVRALGSREDDFNNTLTGRLLLLLESRPLLGQSVYTRLLDKVIDAYFVDFVGNEERFVPAFLINDVLRMWRTFCVNYEFNRKKGGSDLKIKNLKLKYSRMLTCYSAIIYLLMTHTRAGTVSPDDVRAMVASTPTERLERVRVAHTFLAEAQRERLIEVLNELLDDYADFLQLTHLPKSELLPQFDRWSQDWKKNSYRFGQKFAEALAILGESKSRFDGLYRMILI